MPAVYYIRRHRTMQPVATPLGNVTFVPSVDHATVTSYSANVYAAGTVTPVVATQSIGKPTPQGGVITFNMAVTLNALPGGNYDVTIVATSPGGSSESGVSMVFTVPLGGSGPTAATGITVGPSGRNFTTVQAAVNAAHAGDTIVLDEGVTFTEAVTLPNKGLLASPITITSSALFANLPAAGRRTNPTYAAHLPKIVSPGSGAPCLTVALGANNYVLRHLEFPGVPLGFNAIVKIGDAGTTQQFYADEPHHITVDQCYLHGGVVCGQKRGVESHGRYITVSNCYFDHIKSVGQDSQCVSGLNGHGPLTITNNQLRGGTEPILIGGGDPNVRTFMTCTGGASATGCNVSCSEAGHTLSELTVGQGLSVLVGGVWTFTTISTITGTGTTGSLTFASVGGTPDTPGGLRAGVILGMEGPGFGLTVTGNLIGNDPAWIAGVLPQPTGVSAVAASGGGTLAAGTHYYTLQPFNPNGYQANPVNWVNGPESAEVSATLAAPGHITVAWTFDPNATIYRVWRGSTPGARTEWHDAPITPFVDDGTAAGWTTATPFGATKWQIKNTFELKACQNAQVSGNIFQYAWKGNSLGYAWWIKTVNQDGTGSYLQSKNIVLEKNILRHVDGFLEAHGIEAGTAGFGLPGPLTNLTVRNNLLYDSQVTPWGEGSEVYCCSITGGIVNAVIDHNTLPHLTNGTGGGLMALEPPPEVLLTGFVFTNNMVRHETFGVKASGFAQGGNFSLPPVTSGGYTFDHNAIADSNSTQDGAGNFYESAALWEAEFVNYVADGTGADFHLKPTSLYHNAASDGTDIGADVTAVLAATVNALTG